MGNINKIEDFEQIQPIGASSGKWNEDRRL